LYALFLTVSVLWYGYAMKFSDTEAFSEAVDAVLEQSEALVSTTELEPGASSEEKHRKELKRSLGLVYDLDRLRPSRRSND